MRGGVFSKSLKALPVLVLVILLAFTSCQNNGYPGYPFIPPTPIVDITWTGNVDTSWYTGTETPQYNLSNAEQLAGLAAIINAGTTEFAGITINLTQDIDLANRDWTPIGGVYFGEEGQNIYSDPDTNWHGFRGTFNGNNHTISNLAIGSVVYGGPEVNVKDNSYKGLFGNVESGAKIMNLNVHNATIFADAFAGVIAGYLPKSPDSNFNTVEFENINLTGLIEINGKFSLGCILGRNESGNTAIHLNNCKVTADEGSYIAMPSNITDYGMSYSYFGGLVGAVYSNSENNVIENCDVSGLAISGYLTPAGGFVGLTQTLKFNGTNRLADMVIRVSSYAEEAESYARAGAISGFVMNNEGLVNNGTFDIEDVTINYPFASGISSPACNGLVGALQDGTNPTIDFTGVDTTGINFVYIQ